MDLAAVGPRTDDWMKTYLLHCISPLLARSVGAASFWLELLSNEHRTYLPSKLTFLTRTRYWSLLFGSILAGRKSWPGKRGGARGRRPMCGS
jgi:peptidoglycan/LPS O-acetylase OafA/YrhL